MPTRVKHTTRKQRGGVADLADAKRNASYVHSIARRAADVLRHVDGDVTPFVICGPDADTTFVVYIPDEHRDAFFAVLDAAAGKHGAVADEPFDYVDNNGTPTRTAVLWFRMSDSKAYDLD